MESHKNGTTNAHLNHIQWVLLGYLFLINAPSKQKRAIHHAISKPHDILMKIFITRLTEIRNYLPLFPGYDGSKKME